MKFPTASVVSRALRRDCGIITQPSYKFWGYSVSHGGAFSPSISVNVSDAEPTNQREAKRLADELREVYGWTVSLSEGNTIIYVSAVPGKAAAAASLAAWEAKEANK